MITKIWINGKIKDKRDPLIMHDDSGFLRANGVFDSMLAVNGVPVNAQEHYHRLIHDCEHVLRITPDFTFETFMDGVTRILHENGIANDHYARVRCQISGGILKAFLGKPSAPTITISCSRTRTPENQEDVKAWVISDYPRIAGCKLENCKKLDYTRNYNAMIDARARGGNEPILTNTDGNIACASTSALFIVEGAKIITPQLSDGILDSLSRRALIRDFDAIEQSISVERFIAADGICLTNTIRGVRPIIELNGKTYEKRSLDLISALNNQIFNAA